MKYRPAQSSYAGVILGYRWLGGTVGVPGIFFVSPTLAATMGYSGISYDLLGASLTHGKVGLNVHARVGAGINLRHFFLTMALYADVYGLETDHLRVSNNIQGATFSLGARF